MRRRPAGVPVYKPDIYSTDAILDPYPHYQRLRDLGPVVWLSKQKAYALPGTPSARQCCAMTRRSCRAGVCR